MRKLGSTVAAVIAAAVVAASAPRAGAGEPAPSQPAAEELITARRLFQEGLHAEDDGRWAEALEIFQRIEKVVASPTVLFHVGLCNERLGRWAEALNAFDRAARTAEREDARAAETEAHAHIEEVRKKTGHLVIRLHGDASGVTLLLDGKPIHAELAGTGLLVDAGQRRVEARREGATVGKEILVNVPPEKTATVKLTIPEAQAPKAIRAAAGPTGPATGLSSVAPVILVGTASLLGAAAMTTGILAHGRHEAYVEENAAPAPGSLEERRDLRDEGQTLALASTLLTGAALIAGGAAVYVAVTAAPGDAASKPGRPPSRARNATRHVPFIAPWIAAGEAGVVVRGAL